MTNVKFFSALIFFITLNGYACDNKVKYDYMKRIQQEGSYYEKFYGLKAKLKPEQSWESRYKTIHNDYPYKVWVYSAASSFMSGFQIDALLVNPDNCKTLELRSLYAE
ncbi:MAG: hypothetical protein QF441_13210 [Bacteriovoracaceae bacterium]|nr:hypothetical protein [Halobacteriovoraceae bacterium]MDP7321564.1 hypothetical protein [Bacteriovoracaceae bacterium]